MKEFKNENRTKLRKTVNTALKKTGYKPQITFSEDNPYVEAVYFEGEIEDLIYLVFSGEKEKSDAINVNFRSSKK